MRTLRFYKAFPGGNPTILILDPVPAAQRAAVSRALMGEDHLQAEQVGFLDLEAEPVRLDMMGGEFCGNACRSAAAVMAREGRGLAPDEGALCGVLSVSGADMPVRLRVESGSGACWTEMPLPAACGDGLQEIGPGMGVVRLPGITHLCLDEARHPFPTDYVEASRSLRQRHGLDGDAVGCIWYAAGEECAIKPVVWVRSTASTYFETGCGSGSLAVALWRGRGQNFPMALSVRQPSGYSIGVRLDAGPQGRRAWIHGPVALVARGEAFV